MSTDAHVSHGEHHGIEIPHATLRDYAIGFVLSVILTSVPFALVMTNVLSATLTAVIIIGFAAAQIIVHMIYFLHMSPKAESGWTMIALAFTIIVVVIMLSGSLWVMYHLNANMMPMSHGTSQIP
jgi:cytochrome o ubiquinol oxidase operon protein cyoD